MNTPLAARSKWSANNFRISRRVARECSYKFFCSPTFGNLEREDSSFFSFTLLDYPRVLRLPDLAHRVIRPIVITADVAATFRINSGNGKHRRIGSRKNDALYNRAIGRSVDRSRRNVHFISVGDVRREMRVAVDMPASTIRTSGTSNASILTGRVDRSRLGTVFRRQSDGDAESGTLRRRNPPRIGLCHRVLIRDSNSAEYRRGRPAWSRYVYAGYEGTGRMDVVARASPSLATNTGNSRWLE